MMAGSGVKMHEKAPSHITTGNANAFLTTEERRTLALLQRIQIKFATLKTKEKDEVKDNCYNF